MSTTANRRGTAASFCLGRDIVAECFCDVDAFNASQLTLRSSLQRVLARWSSLSLAAYLAFTARTNTLASTRYAALCMCMYTVPVVQRLVVVSQFCCPSRELRRQHIEKAARHACVHAMDLREDRPGRRGGLVWHDRRPADDTPHFVSREGDAGLKLGKSKVVLCACTSSGAYYHVSLC